MTRLSTKPRDFASCPVNLREAYRHSRKEEVIRQRIKIKKFYITDIGPSQSMPQYTPKGIAEHSRFEQVQNITLYTVQCTVYK